MLEGVSKLEEEDPKVAAAAANAAETGRNAYLEVVEDEFEPNEKGTIFT